MAHKSLWVMAMKAIAICVALLAGIIAPVFSQMPGKVEAEIIPATTRRTYEFSGDDVQVVLRKLARDAQMNLALSGIVKGTINFRLVDKTPQEIIEFIIQVNGWAVTEVDGIWYIGARDLLLTREAELIAHRTKIMFDAYVARGFTRAEAMDLIRNVPGGARLQGPPSENQTARKVKGPLSSVEPPKCWRRKS